MPTVTTDDLAAAIIEIREQDVVTIVDMLLANGTKPEVIVDIGREAMNTIGRRFETGEAFIPELIMAGEIMSAVSARVKPHLTHVDGDGRLGCVAVGTVQGDIHDIGKDIVVALLDAAGFEVVDLGVDVPPERFVEAIREHPACTVALSCLLTTGFESMKSTIGAVEAAGLRTHTKIMVGGAPITEHVCDYTGADGFGNDAARALELAKEWSQGGEL